MDHPFFMHVFHTLTEYMHVKRVVHYSSVYGMLSERPEVQIPHQEDKSEKSLPHKISPSLCVMLDSSSNTLKRGIVNNCNAGKVD